MRKKTLKVGDKVKTIDHEYEGVISEIYRSCPMTNRWLRGLSIPIKAESVRSIWYSVDIDDDGGQVCCPKCDVVLR